MSNPPRLRLTGIDKAFGATQALRYLPVPGGYQGSVPLGKNERSWAL